MANRTGAGSVPRAARATHGAKRCLEVGTFTGYSAAWVASVLPADGSIFCCDINESYAAIARKFWAIAGVDGRIELRLRRPSTP